MRLAITLLVFLVCSTFASGLVTIKGVRRAERACRSVIRNRIADFPRTAFHDCIGGCNGCVDISKHRNAGIDEYVAVLQRLYRKFNIAKHMSRADFWATCAVEALTRANRNSRKFYHFVEPGRLSIDLKYGREDCIGGPIAHSMNTFPNPHGDDKEVTKFFYQEFGLDAEESVAIMGAHSLGEAKKRNSGFKGPWVKDGKTLDNRYYQSLLDPTEHWQQENVATNETARWQWNDKDKKFMMLNVDVCLAKDIKPDEQGESKQKSFNKIYTDSPLLKYTKRFAEDNVYWLKVFSRAFEKMVHTLPSGSKAKLYSPFY